MVQTMTDETKDTFDVSDVLELTDEIKATDKWSVDDWEIQGGMYEPFQLTLTLEFNHQDGETATNEQTAKEVLKYLESDYKDKGIPRDIAMAELLMEGFDKDELKTLVEKGEVYEPTPGYLRTT